MADLSFFQQLIRADVNAAVEVFIDPEFDWKLNKLAMELERPWPTD